MPIIVVILTSNQCAHDSCNFKIKSMWHRQYFPISGQHLRAFMEQCTRTETTDEILGRLATESADQSEKEGSDDITNALQRLTEPNLPYHIPSLGSVVSRATTRLKIKPEEAPIPPQMLNQVSWGVGIAQSLFDKLDCNCPLTLSVPSKRFG